MTLPSGFTIWVILRGKRAQIKENYSSLHKKKKEFFKVQFKLLIREFTCLSLIIVMLG